MNKKELEESNAILQKHNEQLVLAIHEHITRVDNLMQKSDNITGKDVGVNLSKYITQLEVALGSVNDTKLTRLFD
ncbi:hypothetical protein N9033_00125 [bacterium]|nr:hypothetical protein [bacterium]